jgi:hypothetical protein
LFYYSYVHTCLGHYSPLPPPSPLPPTPPPPSKIFNYLKEQLTGKLGLFRIHYFAYIFLQITEMNLPFQGTQLIIFCFQ